MLMDDPRDWQARINSLQTAISETLQMMIEVVEAHADDVLAVFGANMSDEMETPFQAIQEALGEITPRQFLKMAAKKRPSSIPEALRSFEKRDFYQLVLETQQINTCIHLLEALHDFADEGFSFFLDGYYSKKNLPVAADCPPRSVMRTIVSQVSEDLGLIQDAVNQRRRLDGRSTQQARAIAMSDQLSKMALGLAIDAEYLPSETTVVTYLAKSIRSRLVPYFDALLISVAYASIQSGVHPSRDFLAIPHEIGHHLFWNGRHPHTQNMLRDELLHRAAAVGIHLGDWRLNWLEEMFADTYALLLAGPVVILDFQDMLDDDMSSHFREDTDKHPIPEIRPFIQTDILRRVKDEDGQIIYAHECDKLDDNWRSWINKHPMRQKYPVRGVLEEMTGQAIVTAVAPVISVIIDTLEAIMPTEREYDGMAGSDDVAKLYSEFQSYIMPDDDDELVNMFLDGNGTEEQLAKILDSYTEISFLKHIHEVTKQAPEKINSAEWLHLLRSYGWSSEGPLGSGGRTSGGSDFTMTAARVNRGNDVQVTVTVTNSVSGTVDLKDTQSNQTGSVYCDMVGTYTFQNVGANAGRVVATNSTAAYFVNYAAKS